MSTLQHIFGARPHADAALAALDRSLAIIEFDPAGHIRAANANFCAVMGYSAAEIVGRHHAMLVDAATASSPDYQAFWERLRRGEFDAREYRRVGKDGREVWIQATYNPVRSRSGRVVKVIKVATDITAQKQRNAEFEAKMMALGRVQAVIEFLPNGEILTANANFLAALGYELAEIQGRHHRLFVDPQYAASPDYEAFWRELQAGNFVADEFKRIGKGGREVWIAASYNPVFDMNGAVSKIVKFATDVTPRVKAVNAIERGLAEIAGNNLQYRIDQGLAPAFEALRADFNASVSRLEEAIRGVGQSAGTIQSAAQEISVASDHLSRRTEQQAASLEETAAALDEITATVKRSAEGARQANEAAGSVSADVVASSRLMNEAVAGMDQIKQSSDQIGQIIGVIDEIAFQTNLLALNAGVEAARAGDAGRGFAVVASEVRALAQRSAEAAKEIKVLISSSAHQVSQGVRLVGNTNTALADIASKIAAIVTLIADMSKAAQEQSAGLGQVNVAINQMDQVTQQNAAMVEEATAASLSLRREADDMAASMGQFRVGLKIAAPATAPERTSHPRPQRRAPLRLASVVKGSAAPAVEDWQEF